MKGCCPRAGWRREPSRVGSKLFSIKTIIANNPESCWLKENNSNNDNNSQGNDLLISSKTLKFIQHYREKVDRDLQEDDVDRNDDYDDKDDGNGKDTHDPCSQCNKV